MEFYKKIPFLSVLLLFHFFFCLSFFFFWLFRKVLFCSVLRQGSGRSEERAIFLFINAFLYFCFTSFAEFLFSTISWSFLRKKKKVRKKNIYIYIVIYIVPVYFFFFDLVIGLRFAWYKAASGQLGFFFFFAFCKNPNKSLFFFSFFFFFVFDAFLWNMKTYTPSYS